MWSRESVPPGSVAEQRFELSSSRPTVIVQRCIPASIGLPADDPRLNPLVSRTRLAETRAQHPYALALARRAHTRPTTPAPWTLEPFILSTLGALSDYSFSPPQKCYNPHDPTLTFVDREDELDFLCEGFASRRALMSCGHAVTPTSLTNWCHRLLDEGQSRFVCGQTGCNVEWSYEEVCKMALLTPEEKKLFEKAMSSNAARGNTKLCPGCESPVVRTNLSDLRVCCSVCSVNRGRTFTFCWQCLRQWKGPAPRSDHCDNDGCCNESVKTLQSCPDILLGSVKCPSIRACPTCGILLQHDNTMCRNVTCPRCKVEFCFVCLKLTDDCLAEDEAYEYEDECFCCMAPRQTSVPVWQKP